MKTPGIIRPVLNRGQEEEEEKEERSEAADLVKLHDAVIKNQQHQSEEDCG